MEPKKEKCAHPSCGCRAKKGSKYCGAYCEGEAKTADIMCNCGHAGCGASKVTTVRGETEIGSKPSHF